MLHWPHSWFYPRHRPDNSPLTHPVTEAKNPGNIGWIMDELKCYWTHEDTVNTMSWVNRDIPVNTVWWVSTHTPVNTVSPVNTVISVNTIIPANTVISVNTVIPVNTTPLWTGCGNCSHRALNLLSLWWPHTQHTELKLITGPPELWLEGNHKNSVSLSSVEEQKKDGSSDRSSFGAQRGCARCRNTTIQLS